MDPDPSPKLVSPADASADQPKSEATGPLAGLNLSDLRLSQDFGASAGVKKVILTIPVRKPSRQAFVRVRPGEEWRLLAALLTLKEERETYLVTPSMASDLGLEVAPSVLRLAIDRQGVLFLWPLRLPREDGRPDSWGTSALEAADMAESQWVSVRSNMSLGAYEVFAGSGSLAEPEWPDLTMEQAVKIAFKDRFIDSVDHPVLRRLRGEI